MNHQPIRYMSTTYGITLDPTVADDTQAGDACERSVIASDMCWVDGSFLNTTTGTDMVFVTSRLVLDNRESPKTISLRNM